MVTTWTRHRATKRTHNRLKAMQDKVDAAVLSMAADWADQDQYICNALEDIRRTVAVMVDQLAQDMDDTLSESNLQGDRK